MQIAVISDIHGNWSALSKVMTELNLLGIDKIVCLGDMVNPLPSSRRVLEFILGEKIPSIRGNHEDYIISSFRNPEHEVNHAPQFKPIHVVSKSFESRHVDLISQLPLKITHQDAASGDLLFCHASPSANNTGWKFGISDELASTLDDEGANTIICGHWHDPQTIAWQDKTLVTAGSVGLPLSGKTEAEFLVLESGPGFWKHRHLSVAYDFEKTVDEYLSSGWFSEGGPMAWLLMCELATGTRQLSHFFPWFHDRKQKSSAEPKWSDSIQDFLEERGQWELVKGFLDS